MDTEKHIEILWHFHFGTILNIRAPATGDFNKKIVHF